MIRKIRLNELFNVYWNSLHSYCGLGMFYFTMALLIWFPLNIMLLLLFNYKVYVCMDKGKVVGGFISRGIWLRHLWAWPKRKGYGSLLFKFARKMIGKEMELSNPLDKAKKFYKEIRK